MNKNNINVKNIVVLQVTSPLYTYDDIDKAIIKFKNSPKKTLVSVCEPIQHPNDMIYHIDGKLRYNKLINRQDYDECFFENGCIYISDVEEYLKNNIFINEDTELFKMDIKSGVDVDTNFDLEILNSLMRK